MLRFLKPIRLTVLLQYMQSHLASTQVALMTQNADFSLFLLYCNYSFWIQGSTFLDQVINKIQATVPHSTEPLSQAALTHDNPTLSEP